MNAIIRLSLVGAWLYFGTQQLTRYWYENPTNFPFAGLAIWFVDALTNPNVDDPETSAGFEFLFVVVMSFSIAAAVACLVLYGIRRYRQHHRAKEH